MTYKLHLTINGSSRADDCAACCFHGTCVKISCRAPQGHHYETDGPSQASHTPKYIEVLTSPDSTHAEDCEACCFSDMCIGRCRVAPHHHYDLNNQIKMP